MIYVALILAALAFAAWLRLRGKPVLYSDIEVNRHDRTLVSHRYGLAGRPDRIERRGRYFVPVEVKSRSCGLRGPFGSERAQLWAYCLLIEEEMGAHVIEGVLEYADRRVTVPFGQGERVYIVALLAEMRAADGEVRRNHWQPAKCRGCGFQLTCGEVLA